MDQYNIGKFIAICRTENNLTQAQLAEKLGVKEKTVAKWELGKSLPDSSIILDVCKKLNITLNDLLTGEIVSKDNYNQQLEQNLLESVKQKQKDDKRLLSQEIFIGVLLIIVFFF